MVTSTQCIKKWGKPSPSLEGNYMTSWKVPKKILDAFAHVRFSALGTVGFPKNIYCNQLMPAPLEKALNAVIDRGLTKDLKTWDGCFNVRLKRGQTTPSLHSWGCAIDVNAFENTFGGKVSMKAPFVACFTDNGFEWGGTWQQKDGMHFQLKVI